MLPVCEGKSTLGGILVNLLAFPRLLMLLLSLPVTEPNKAVRSVTGIPQSIITGGEKRGKSHAGNVFV